VERVEVAIVVVGERFSILAREPSDGPCDARGQVHIYVGTWERLID
jgi:hypothetical protein